VTLRSGSPTYCGAARHPRPLRRGTPSSARRYLADVHRPDPPPLDIIRIYGLRFRSKFSFKQALRAMGAYAYHFWMAAMTPLRRVSGNQYLHRKSDAYRNASAVRSLPTIVTSNSAHRPGLASDPLRDETHPDLAVLRLLDTNRSARIGPSELVVAIALRNTLPQFLASAAKPSNLVKFIRDRLDLSRTEGTSLAA